MAILPIVKYPDPRLKQISKPVTDPGSLRTLVMDMYETMYATNGAGLAAIQVGEPIQLFIIDAMINGGKESDPPIVFINPQFIELSKELDDAEEGCLSFPDIFVPVKRSLRATMRATNLDGQQFEISGEGLFARAMQHETDHLNGKILVDYVGRLKKQLIERRLARAERDNEDQE